jgi:8-oxo-dGTP diphosphatase
MEVCLKDCLSCPTCGAKVARYRNPFPTVDIIIRNHKAQVLLIRRRYEPIGWALPGGFVDYGESLEAAARREAREETGLELIDLQQFHAYSDPARDPRQHNISMVFIALGQGVLSAGDDARAAQWFSLDALPAPLCFDHADILADYRERAPMEKPSR